MTESALDPESGPKGRRGAGGISSVAKAARILKTMSEARGLRLTDIASSAGLDKATTMRLLDELVKEGFISRDPQSRLYALGTELVVLGAAALNRLDPRQIVQPSLLRLADEFEDTILLSVPSGHESLCLAMQEGSFPLRANFLSVGGRRLLGVGAGSLALLAWMPEKEIDAILPRIAAGLAKQYPQISNSLLEASIRDARHRGYALTLNVVVEQMGGLAVPLLDHHGYPIAALSIAALSTRIAGREAAIVAALKREAAICEPLLIDSINGRVRTRDAVRRQPKKRLIPTSAPARGSP